MKAEELKLGSKVYDAWFPEWGYGEVVKILKTRWHIQFHKELLRYDKPHLCYLKPKP